MEVIDKIYEKAGEAKTYAKDNLKTWVLGACALITEIIYVFYSLVGFKRTDNDPLVISAAIIVSVVCALLTKTAYGEMGFTLGYRSEKYQRQYKTYNDSCNICMENVDKATDFYIIEESLRKKQYRKSVLASACLKYNDWFNEDGEYINSIKENDLKTSNLSKKEIKAVKKCINVNIYVPDMFKERSRSVENDTKKEKTDAAQRTTVLTKNFVFAIAPSVIQVLFVPVVNGWNWSVVLSGLITISIWTITGLIQLYANYNFVVKEKTDQLRDKTELMGKFNKYCETANLSHLIENNDKLQAKELENA